MRRALFLLLACCGSNSLTLEMIEQNNSGQNGTATLTETPRGLEVLVSIKRSTVPGSQNSHIHEGRCDNVGAITAGVSPFNDKQLQLSSKDGGAELDGDNIVFKVTLSSMKLSDLRDGNHVINVHDARDNSLYVSCGEID